MIPCKLNKCLKYPACKNKRVITCSPLRDYSHNLRPELFRLDKQVWIELEKDFPNLIAIQSEGANLDYHTLYLNRHKVPSKLLQEIGLQTRKYGKPTRIIDSKGIYEI